MVQAVEDINKKQELGNLTLGYRILDSCSDVTTALKTTMSFRKNYNRMDGAEQPSPPVLAVVGGYHSEISAAVTRELNLEYIPQISYGSTSSLLSDKTRFPSFMRTVPKDDHQVHAIITFLKGHQWTWVGVVTTDGDYGHYAVVRLQQLAKDHNICFAFISILPDGLGDNSLMNSTEATVKNIIENLRGALKKATFHMDGKNYSFNNNGDLNTGYDVIRWRQTPPHHDIVAHYSIKSKNFSQKTYQDFLHVTGDVISRCSNSCAPGFWKQSMKGQPVCCHECYPCPEDHFSNTSDSIMCHQCNTETQYSSMGSNKCLDKKPVYLKWNDKYHDTLLAFTALGALLTLAVGIIFFARWNTPVVRSSVGPICVLLLFSLLSTFVSVVLFGGEPEQRQCQARQVLFGLSFTLCVSCIMVKSFKIILAFEFDPRIKSVLKKLYKPYIIIAVCLSGQVLICALWLALKSPKPKWEKLKNKEERLLICNEMSFPAFGAMLSYIGVLALICFGVAFKGRNLPQSYNDAKFITFAMLIYFISWIIFGPVYVSVTGQYLPAVEMVVILISAYGILFCQFFTKCYIILFKKEANTEEAFCQDVRNYSSHNNA